MNVQQKMHGLPDWGAETSRRFFRWLVGPLVRWINHKWPEGTKKPIYIRQLPNTVTSIRIVGVLWLAYRFYHSRSTKERAKLAVAAVAVLSTDGIDGELSRGTDCVTTLGKAIDPIADKLFFALFAIALALSLHRDKKGSWILSLVLAVAVLQEARVLVTGTKVGTVARRIEVEPEGSVTAGKVKFFFQAMAVLLGWAFYGKKSQAIVVGGLICAFPFSIQSLNHYRQQLEMLRDIETNLTSLSEDGQVSTP